MMVVTGNIGQSNYATANALLDGELHKYPNAFSLIPGISGVGYLARSAGDIEHSRLDSWSITPDSKRTAWVEKECANNCLSQSRMALGNSPQERSGRSLCSVLRWDAVERDMGLSSSCAHLHSQEPSDSLGRTRYGGETNSHDHSELLKQVVDLLDISMVDFSPEQPFSAYGLSSLGATRISQVV